MAAAAAMPHINTRTPSPPGAESSFLARAGRPELVPSQVALMMSKRGALAKVDGGVPGGG